MPQSAPILIMSSERSGSNLLRTLLSNHSGLAGPMAAQFLNLFGHRAAEYAPLDRRENQEAFVELLLAVANHKIFAWDLDLDVSAFVAQEDPQDLMEAWDGLYRARAAKEGARRYVCKENRLFDHAESILQRFPEARILYLARDPRDYVLSWMRAPLLNHTPHQAACAWRDEQLACLAMERRLGDQVLRVTYEALVQDPPGTMTRVLEFLGEPVEPACFQVQGDKNKAQEWSSFWKNLTRPVQGQNFEKWRGQFRPRTLEMIETLCAEPMRALGYAADSRQAWRPGPWFEFRERRLAARNDARLRAEHASTVAVIEDRDRMIEARMQAWRDRRDAHAPQGA